jgi:hypothetical protein
MGKQGSSHLASGAFVESLETRRLLSHSVFTTRLQFFATVGSGEIGSSLTIPASAKLTAAGLPLRTAAIEFLEDGTTVIGTAQTARSGYASIVLPNFYVGKHTLEAEFVGSERYVKSVSGSDSATITAAPSHTTTGDGIQESTIVAGNGSSTVANGDEVEVDYNAYLEAKGKLFDSTAGHTQLTFEDGDPGVYPGFNEGLVGMKLGETREIVIPGPLGWADQPPNNFPANAVLVFVVTMDNFNA